MNAIASAKQAYLNYLAEAEQERLKREREAEEYTARALQSILNPIISAGYIPEEFREYAIVNDPVNEVERIGGYGWTGSVLVWVKYHDYPTVQVEVHIYPELPGEVKPKWASYATYRVWSNSTDFSARPDCFNAWDVAFGYAVWLHDQRGAYP